MMYIETRKGKKMWKTLLAIFLFKMSYCSNNEAEIVLIADPRILSIPIQESDNPDPLIDLRDQSEISFGPSPEIPDNQDYTKLRSSVYQRLIEAQKALPDGLRLRLYEGYRSIGLQSKLFNDRYLLLQHEHPDWNNEQLFNQTIKMVSPVINLDGSTNVPPHSTGAAADVYLIDSDGKVLDMGIKTDDSIQDMDGSISRTDSSKISAEARRNRDIMSFVLTKAGLVNYPWEYWHWSYGDRYWAYQLGKEKALYGTVE